MSHVCQPGLERQNRPEVRLALKKRQTHTKDRPRTRSTLNFDRTSMRFGNPPRDREAQSNTAILSRPGFVGTVEAIKYIRQIFCANANSGIPKLCNARVIAALEPYDN